MSTTPSREELPLPDWNDIPLGTLTERIRPLDEDGITMLLDYEEAHGHRLPVTTILRSRLEQLRDGAEPAGTLSDVHPETSRSSAGSRVTPATAAVLGDPAPHGLDAAQQEDR